MKQISTQVNIPSVRPPMSVFRHHAIATLGALTGRALATRGGEVQSCKQLALLKTPSSKDDGKKSILFSDFGQANVQEILWNTQKSLASWSSCLYQFSTQDATLQMRSPILIRPAKIIMNHHESSWIRHPYKRWVISSHLPTSASTPLDALRCSPPNGPPKQFHSQLWLCRVPTPLAPTAHAASKVWS